jgi:BlaI family transcriptional regulator, penicillinase repressor
MARKKEQAGARLLTDVELELMTIIWSQGRTTVKEVADALPRTRPLAYTSVATVMKILEHKGYLKCEKRSYAHTFSPLVEKAAYEESCLEHVVDNVFDGEPVALVQRLLTAKRLSAAERRAIEAALRELAPVKKRG